MPALEYLPARGNDRVLPLAILELGAFLDRVERDFRGAAKDREHRHLVAEIDGVIAPLARNDHAAIRIQDPLEFGTFEADGPVAIIGASGALCGAAPVGGP